MEKLDIKNIALNELKAYKNNPRRISEEAINAVANSIKNFGFKVPVVVDKDNVIVAGHTRVKAAEKLGLTEVPCIVADDLTSEQIKAFRLADNKTSELSGWDFEKLDLELEEIDFDMSEFGFEFKDLSLDLTEDIINNEESKKTLAEKFGFAPFTIIDTRTGKWQGRKKAWLNLGIESEVGRSGKLVFSSPSSEIGFYNKKNAKEKELGRKLSTAEYKEKYYVPTKKGVKSGTSIFDPVLCELIYRWFSSENDIVLDPFAGGSVRGIVASKLKREYTGIDLRKEQIEANIEQSKICTELKPKYIIGNSLNIKELTDNLQVDFLFSCPPYVDLEVYSDNPEDLSTMDYPEFLRIYREIINKSCLQLKEDRFACFVVGDVRDKKGHYYGFVSDTIKAFQDAGLNFYNEAILVNVVGNAAIRASKSFSSARKLCKIHQNVLIFVKGNAKNATLRLGECEFEEIKEDTVVEEL